ncbi:ABC transporter ATP-binding protein [Motiliproteus sp.]|uniref:ABC transporter ATP-binding protein n=1 Tax=Motiliproteus sp. TaxID=1898955 RepID=UPI003BA943BF
MWQQTLDADVRAMDTQADRRASLAWLFGFVRPHLRAVGLLLLLSMLASLLVLVQPYLTKRMIDEGLLAGNFEQLLWIASTLLAVAMGSTLLGGINRYCHTRLSGQILFALRESVYRHLQTLSPTFYARRRTGDVLSRLDGDVAEIQRFAVDGLFSAVSGLLGLVGSVAMLLWLNWQLALAMLALIPLQLVYLRFIRPLVQRRTRRLRERSADISSFLVETLGAMKFIQSVGAEGRESERLRKLNRSYLDELLHLQLLEFAAGSVPSSMTTLFRAGAFLIGGYAVIQGEMELGALIAFSAYLGMAVGPVHTLLGLYMAVQRLQVSLDRVCELTQASPLVTDSVSNPAADLVESETRASTEAAEIRIAQLNFGYEAGADPVLRQASALIAGASRVGIVGSSGAGKSTLIDLLQRHYDPQQGAILLDGVDIRQLPLSQLRRRVAVVSQEVVLFRGSIEDNVRYACPEAEPEALEQALQQAGLTELIDSLPQGGQTQIGERGARLSGGQRQRIAIARALLQQPQVLILDEATSAVDSATESQVMASVESLFRNRTLIVISHRASTLARMDQLLRLENGRLTPISAAEAFEHE